MRHLVFTLFLLVISFLGLYAHDTIILINGDSIAAKILTVAPKEVSFKKVNNLSGPTYTMEVNKIKRIVYDNGSFEDYHEGNKATTVDESKKGYGKNMIQLQPAKLFSSINSQYLCGAIGYQRLFAKAYLGFKFGGVLAYDQKLAGVSYELLFYPSKANGILKYYIGIGGKSGMFYTYNLGDGEGIAYNAVQLINGIQYHASNHFMIGLHTGIGLGYALGEVQKNWGITTEQVPFTALNIGLQLGYRF
jgi:hypothetical protein